MTDAPIDPPPPSRFRATAMLLVVTLLWGLSFPLVKNWQNAAHDCPGGVLLSSATLIVLRMLLALLLLGFVRPGLFTVPNRREHLAGALLGLAFFAGFIFQVMGLAQTTPARSAFITSLTSAWVPLLIWAGWRLAVPAVTLLGLGLGVAGAALLSEIDVDANGWLSRGDWRSLLRSGEGLTLLASLIFAVQVVLLDRLGQVIRSQHMTVSFFATTGVAAILLSVGAAASGPGVTAWLHWLVALLGNPAVVRDLLLLTVFSTVLAFYWMNTYQPLVPASRAALIYLLESVFASILSLLLKHENLTARLLLGGSLILGGNLLVELPGLLRGRRRRQEEVAGD